MSQGKKVPVAPSLFIPSADLYAHIPKRHFYEQLAHVLDLSFVRELTAPLYAAKMGRPSLDPVVFFKCMLVAYFENIVADEALEFRIADSLVIRKYLGYGVEERTPDESTLRKTRQRMPEETFHAVFAHVLHVCADHGLVNGRALGMDSTVVDANASMDALLHKEVGCTYEEFMLALQRHDRPEATRDEAKAADRFRPGKASNAEWASSTDPDARIMQHADKHTHLSYRLDATVDLETGIIVAAGADHADAMDQETCLDRVDEAVAQVKALGGTPRVIVGDKGHHSGENLRGIAARGLVPLLSSLHRRTGAAGFRREDFTYDAEADAWTCPAGQQLTRRQDHRQQRVYGLRGRICRACPHFGICTKAQSGRTLAISRDDAVIQANRERTHDPLLRPLLQIRRQRGEAPFGHWKQSGGLRRLSGHGLGYVTKKTLMAAVAWNLLRVLRSLGAQLLVSQVAVIRRIWLQIAGTNWVGVSLVISNRQLDTMKESQLTGI